MNDAQFNYQPAGLGKRLMAAIYDTLLLAAVLFIAEILPVVLNHGEAVSRDNGILVFYFLHPMYLLLVCFGYLGWFWVHGGQTLGMRTWRLQVLTASGKQLNWQVAALRFVFAMVSWLVLGLGYLWSLLDAGKRTWHDRASTTILIQLAKK